jgi:hypothetical protein
MRKQQANGGMASTVNFDERINMKPPKRTVDCGAFDTHEGGTSFTMQSARSGPHGASSKLQGSMSDSQSA